MKHTYTIQGVKVIFDPEAEKHGDRYTTEDRKRFTGVTSALQAIAKPALVDWAAKEAYLDCIAGADPKACLEEKDYAHKRKSQAGKDKGTDVHNEFENFDTSTDPLVLPVREFFEKEGIKILAHEFPSFSVKYWYAGTFDALVEWKGKRYIVDWKTSSGVYGRDYFAQCSAYLHAFKETYPDKIQPEGYLIIRVDKKTGKFDPTINPLFKGNLSPYGNVYFVGNPEQVKSDFQYFLSCLAVYRLGLVDYFDETIAPLVNQYISK